MGAPGCDDAPLVDIKIDRNSPKHVTFVYPYYENETFFKRQVKHWESYPFELRKHLSIIVIDDCSPKSISEVMLYIPVAGIDLELYRIDIDVRWNWLAARNIGMKHAREGWCMLTDMDHIVGEETLRTMIYGDHDEHVIYRFSRTEEGNIPIHPHPNSWFMTRKMYWNVGGYDEALSGFYGTDGEYRRRCAATASIKIMTATLDRYEHLGDSSTIRYKRKQPEDAAVKKMIRARKPGWHPRVLSYPYHEVMR